MTSSSTNPIAIGDKVKFGQHAGITIAIASPGDPDTAIDLVYEDLGGRRRIESGVPHGSGPGCYLTIAEIEAGRPPTPLELLEAARRRGERVPEVGMIVFIGEQVSQDVHFLDIRRLRLRITDVHSLEKISGLVLAERDEAQPEAPDVIRRRAENVLHASQANARAVACNFRGSWEYPDEPFIAQGFGPIKVIDLFPPFICGSAACKSPCASVFSIRHSTQMGAKPIDVCISCYQKILDILGLPLPGMTPAYRAIDRQSGLPSPVDIEAGERNLLNLIDA